MHDITPLIGYILGPALQILGGFCWVNPEHVSRFTQSKIAMSRSGSTHKGAEALETIRFYAPLSKVRNLTRAFLGDLNSAALAKL